MGWGGGTQAEGGALSSDQIIENYIIRDGLYI